MEQIESLKDMKAQLLSSAYFKLTSSIVCFISAAAMLYSGPITTQSADFESFMLLVGAALGGLLSVQWTIWFLLAINRLLYVDRRLFQLELAQQSTRTDPVTQPRKETP